MKFINGITDYIEYIKNRRENKKYLEKKIIVNEMLAKVNAGEELSLADQVRLVQCVNVSALTGKLDGFWGVSTSVLMNPICQGRARKEGCICKDCYAAAGVARWAPLSCALEINYIIFNSFDICEEAWATLAIPSTNGKARIESHGDTATYLCAKNYIRIIKTHKYFVITVFSKNKGHYRIAFKAEGKPSNMIFILSSEYENIVAKVPEDMKQWVDKVFTVFTLEYCKKHGVKINCGTYDENYKKIDHTCKNCMKCYTLDDDSFYINELKK